jgi:hypothetical protein
MLIDCDSWRFLTCKLVCVLMLIHLPQAWPYGAYCTSGENFAPGTDNGELGWTLKGWCDATVTTTTTTTTPWVGTCEWLNVTAPVTINPWSASALSTYSAGTRVRVADRVYKCKEW